MKTIRNKNRVTVSPFTQAGLDELQERFSIPNSYRRGKWLSLTEKHLAAFGEAEEVDKDQWKAAFIAPQSTRPPVPREPKVKKIAGGKQLSTEAARKWVDKFKGEYRGQQCAELIEKVGRSQANIESWLLAHGLVGRMYDDDNDCVTVALHHVYKLAGQWYATPKNKKS